MTPFYAVLVTVVRKRKEKKFPLAPLGVLAPVSAHTGHFAQPPIDTSGNFPARVSAESISPNQNIAQWGVKGGY